VTENRETPEEVQLRLHHEKECRRIADIVKRELPQNMGFVLVTATHGGGQNATFSSMQYVSSIERDDTARMLNELLDNWQDRGTGTQPTVGIATMLREFVYQLRSNPWQRLLHGARCSVRDAEGALTAGNKHRAKGEILKGAAELLAVLDQLERPQEGN
jgi:hypothetical protein